MKRLMPLFVSLLAILFSSFLFGQQADEGQAPQSGDNSADIVMQIQQLRADLDRLTEQVDRLNHLVQNLQATRTPAARTERTKTAPPTSPTPTATPTIVPPPSESPNDENVPVTVLVFHDGKRVETRNYAIVGESIWVYSEQESKKYRVADLDLEATKKVNSDRGVLFQVPPAR
jgi:hypothetical protein